MRKRLSRLEFLVYYSREEKPFCPYNSQEPMYNASALRKKCKQVCSCIDSRAQTKAVGNEICRVVALQPQSTCIRDENNSLRRRMRCMECRETEECISPIKCAVLSLLNSKDLKVGKEDGARNLMYLSENLCCMTGPEATTTALTQSYFVPL